MSGSTTININVGGNAMSAELDKALAAADTIKNRLFFLQEIFRELSNPNLDKIELSFCALIGFHEILDDMIGKAIDVTEILDSVQRR